MTQKPVPLKEGTLHFLKEGGIHPRRGHMRGTTFDAGDREAVSESLSQSLNSSF